MEPEAKPPLPDKLRPLAAAAIKRHQKRGAPPDIASRNMDQRGDLLLSPYREEDFEAWVALLLDCFGTRLHSVGQAFMQQLASLCPDVFYDGEARSRPDEEALRQALAIVTSMKPSNEAEAALAAQAVALHFTSMKIGARIAQYGSCDPRTAASLAALVKAYSGALTSMKKLKGGGRSSRQTIKVVKESHVHYHDERHVHLPGEGGGKSGGRAEGAEPLRAHASHSTGEPEVLPPLRCEDEGRGLLSLPGGEGEGALSSPRRREGIGRTEG